MTRQEIQNIYREYLQELTGATSETINQPQGAQIAAILVLAQVVSEKHSVLATLDQTIDDVISETMREIRNGNVPKWIPSDEIEYTAKALRDELAYRETHA